MSKLSLLEINQSQLDTTPVIDGQLIVCLDTGNAYRDSTAAHVKIGSDLEVVSELPLAPLANKIYFLKPDKLYMSSGGNLVLLNSSCPVMTGATGVSDGHSGLVPAPEKGAPNRFLRSDGSWSVPPRDEYNEATSTIAGLMSATDKEKLDGIDDNANHYEHPMYTSHVNGFYKITVDLNGHVSEINEVIKSDITALGIPEKDTQYEEVTQRDAGLMTADDKKKLDAFADSSSYALKADIVAVYRYKGSVPSIEDLPTEGQIVGDVYDVADGMNYAWDGTKWDALGQRFTVDRITEEEIDKILAS
nr:MAG TPA: hypothetical protein [Caudoviricetes sp.]